MRLKTVVTKKNVQNILSYKFEHSAKLERFDTFLLYSKFTVTLGIQKSLLVLHLMRKLGQFGTTIRSQMHLWKLEQFKWVLKLSIGWKFNAKFSSIE